VTLLTVPSVRQPGLHKFMGLGKAVWKATRAALTTLFTTDSGKGSLEICDCATLRAHSLSLHYFRIAEGVSRRH
jgi:hypothetical protein